MSDVDRRKIGVGLALIAVSTVLVFGPGTVATALPTALVTLGTLGLAAGALFVGTARNGRPV